MRRVSIVAFCIFGLTAFGIGAVQQNPNGVEIFFDNGAHLTIDAPGGQVRGLTEVTVEGTALRSAEFAAHPVFRFDEAPSHTGCILESVEEDGESVVLHCMLQRDEGDPDRLIWRFEPREDSIDGRDFAGFAYRYRFETTHGALAAIRDLSTWELGGDIEGKFVQPGPMGPMDLPYRTRFDTSWRSWTFCSTPWFRFQCGDEGMLYDVYEDVCPAQSWLQRRADSPLLRTYDQVLQELKGTGSTPYRRIMFCSEGVPDGLKRVDAYTSVYDHLLHRIREKYDIQDPQYIPICRAPQKEDESFFKRDEDLDMVAELGFRGMWMATFESRSTVVQKRPRTNAGVFSLVPAELLGGMEALADLAEAARQRGLDIYTWAPGNKIVTESPVYQEHPEWHLKLPEGKPPLLAGSTDLYSGYYDYAIDSYRRLHEATGIDSAWFDTFGLAASRIQVRDDGTRFFQTRRAFEMIADTQKAGIVNCQLEGAGPAGQDAVTMGYYRNATPLDYKSAPYVGSCRPEQINYYYRWIANRSFLMLPVKFVLWTYEYKAIDLFPGLQQQVRQANHDWAAVKDLVQTRRLIAAEDDPWRDVGTEWTTGDSPDRAVYAYGEFDYPIPPGATVTDVTEGEEISCAGMLHTATCHTYRIEMPE